MFTINEEMHEQSYLFNISVKDRTVSCLQPDGLTEKQKEEYLPEERKLFEQITRGLENGLESLYIRDILRDVLAFPAYSTFTLRKAMDTAPETFVLEIGRRKSTRYGG